MGGGLRGLGGVIWDGLSQCLGLKNEKSLCLRSCSTINWRRFTLTDALMAIRSDGILEMNLQKELARDLMRLLKQAVTQEFRTVCTNI